MGGIGRLFWEEFDRSVGALDTLGALCWVSHVFFSILCIYMLSLARPCLTCFTILGLVSKMIALPVHLLTQVSRPPLLGGGGALIDRTPRDFN